MIAIVVSLCLTVVVLASLRLAGRIAASETPPPTVPAVPVPRVAVPTPGRYCKDCEHSKLEYHFGSKVLKCSAFLDRNTGGMKMCAPLNPNNDCVEHKAKLREDRARSSDDDHEPSREDQKVDLGGRERGHGH